MAGSLESEGGDPASSRTDNTHADLQSQLYPSTFGVHPVCAVPALLCHNLREVRCQKELGKGPGVVDLQRWWGLPEQSYKG